MTDKPDIMDLIDAYAEARHRCGCAAYNATTATARQLVVDYIASIGAGGVQALSAAPAEAPTSDVQAKIDSNTWDHFGEILPTLKAISHGDWYWGANSRCKYIEIRIDTRDGGCILYDRERARISPEQFAHQSHHVGKMQPWPAANQVAAAPTPPAEQQAPTLRRVERTTFPNSPAHRALHAFVSAMHDNHIKRDDMRAAMLWFLGYEECDATLQQAAPKAAPGEQQNCERCSGSGEDPAGYYDQSRGDAGSTFGGPCRECNGTGAAPQQEAQEPALFVSAKQLADLADPSHATAGSYLPARKTRAGRFTQPLYTAPQPAPAPLSDDTKRLAWMADGWTPGHEKLYAQHVLETGGVGDLDDLRTFIDKQIAAQGGK